MGKYLKLFNVHSDYEAFTQTEDFIFPNVSYCLDQTDIVHYNPIVPPQETRLMVTYNVEDASQSTPLYFYNTDRQVIGVNMFDKVEIDGTEVSVADLDSNNGSYQLSVGEHTVAYTLKDPTFIGIELDGQTEIPSKVGATFMECNAITNVTIPNSVTTIGSSAFANCTGLTSIDIPNSVTSIGVGAFVNCSNLTSVTIPNSVTIIGAVAFGSCTSLTSVTIPDSVTSIGGRAFFYCSGLTSVTIGDGVTTIGRNAFQYCSKLTSVTIGSGVTSISNYAFCGCPLDAISKAAIEAINPNATRCDGGGGGPL